jgi:hypothetical protein
MGISGYGLATPRLHELREFDHGKVAVSRTQNMTRRRLFAGCGG